MEWQVLDQTGSELSESGEELLQVQVEKAPARKKKMVACPICGSKEVHVKRHIFREHLPFYMAPDSACWACGIQQGQRYKVVLEHVNLHCSTGPCFGDGQLQVWTSLMTGVIRFLCTETGVRDGGELLRHVVERGWFPTCGARVTHTEHVLWQYFERASGFTAQSRHEVSPPNSVASLFHWRVLANILQGLPESVRERFRDLEQEVEVIAGDVRSGQESYVLVDSHMHFAELLQRCRCGGLEEVLQSQPTSKENHQLQFVISNHCYPWKWPRSQEQEHILRDHRLRLAIGVHPRFCSRFRRGDVDVLDRYLRQPGVVALGEIGIDRSVGVKARDQEKQIQVLEAVLPLAARRKVPVILHCRGNEAMKDCLGVLCRFLGRDHPIHCHCFTGSEEDMEQWIAAFPYVKFGITSTVSDRLQYPSLAITVGHMPLERIMVETDAPFLVPAIFKERAAHSNPGMILEVVRAVAEIKNLPLRVVAEVTRQNACQLYRLGD